MPDWYLPVVTRLVLGFSGQLFSMDYSKKKSWQAAREDCVSRGADLMSVHTAEEEIFLSSYSKGKTKWIGLKHNPVEGGEGHISSSHSCTPWAAWLLDLFIGITEH